MSRLTRLIVHQPESILRIPPLTRHLITTARFQLPPSQPPSLYFPRRKQSSLRLAATRRKMESNPPENLSGSVIDGFVNVKNPADEELASSAYENPNYVHVEGENDGDDDVGERNSEVEGESMDEIMKNVVVLTCENVDGGNCNVYLVGTAHVSEESCREVQAVISCLKPEVVFLELCSSRVSILTLKDLKVPTINEMIGMWKKKQNTFGIIYSWFLAKVAEKLEVLPGSEFRVAFEEAMKCGSKVILGDRPVNVTLRRTWGKMPLWHKTKLIYSLLFQAVFLPNPEDLEKMLKEMNDVDMLTLVIQEMSKEYPTLMKTLVNERDQYMSSALLQIAGEHTSVVAVIGKGHLQGIRRNWKQPIESPVPLINTMSGVTCGKVKELLEIPSRSPIISVVKVLSTVGVAVAGVAIVSGIFFASKKQS